MLPPFAQNHPPETIKAYARHITKLASQYGSQCWFIIYQADILMRSDHMDRIRRSAAADVIRTVDGAAFDKEKPWPQVLAIAASDVHPQSTAFWTEHVHHPAMRFIMSAQIPRAVKDTSPAPPPGKVQRTQHNSVCRDYIEGRCFGNQCPQGLSHPACPFCHDFHARMLCPFKNHKGTKGASAGKGAYSPRPPPPPPPAVVGHVVVPPGGKGAGKKTKGGKNKGKTQKAGRKSGN